MSGINIFNKFLPVILFIGFNLQAVNSQNNVDITNDSIQARTDLIDIVKILVKWDPEKHKSPDDKKVFFSLVPFSGGSSEDGLAISSINAAFYLGNAQNTNLSNISFYPNTNFESRFQFIVTPNLWFSRNSWNVPGKIELSGIKQETYGLGTNTPDDSLNNIVYNLSKVIFSINREIFPNYFIGAGYSLYNFYNIEEEWEEKYPSEFEKYKYGTDSSSFSSGMSFNIFYNSRKNINNPQKGFYANLYYLNNNELFGSDYNWQSLYFDTRKYISFSKIRHRTLAFWGFYWKTWGEVPYLNLPASGHDFQYRSSRGYNRGRYCGKSLLYAETEYRFDLTKSGLLGAVTFINFQSFTEPETNRFRYVKPAAGLGLRVKFNKYSDSNMIFDVAFGKNSVNWYVNLNEAF